MSLPTTNIILLTFSHHSLLLPVHFDSCQLTKTRVNYFNSFGDFFPSHMGTVIFFRMYTSSRVFSFELLTWKKKVRFTFTWTGKNPARIFQKRNVSTCLEKLLANYHRLQMIFFLMKNATTELAKLNSTHILLRNVYFWLTYVKVYGFSYHAKSYCYHFSSFKVSPSYIDWNKVICGRILNWLRELTFVFFRKKPEERDWYKIFANFQRHDVLQ